MPRSRGSKASWFVFVVSAPFPRISCAIKPEDNEGMDPTWSTGYNSPGSVLKSGAQVRRMLVRIGRRLGMRTHSWLELDEQEA